MEITKYVLPVVVGAMSGMILITGGEAVIHHFYPPSADTDLYDADSLARYIKTLPENAYYMKLANYTICSFLAGLISTLVALRTTIRPAIIVAIILTLAGVYYVMYMPYPKWFAIASLVVYIPLTLLGYLVARKRPTL